MKTIREIVLEFQIFSQSCFFLQDFRSKTVIKEAIMENDFLKNLSPSQVDGKIFILFLFFVVFFFVVFIFLLFLFF